MRFVINQIFIYMEIKDYKKALEMMLDIKYPTKEQQDELLVEAKKFFNEQKKLKNGK